MKRIYKKVVIWKNNEYSYFLCHTLGGILNPFAEFDTEQAAKEYANTNNLVCCSVYTGSLSDYKE